MSHPSESISVYLDGQLDVGARKELVEHIDSCGRCAAEIEEIQAVRAAVRSLPLLDVPEETLRGAGAEIEKVVPLHRNRGIWVGAAAAVVALIIAVAALVTPPPTSVSFDDLSSRFGARLTLDPAFGPAKVPVPELQVVSE